MVAGDNLKSFGLGLEEVDRSRFGELCTRLSQRVFDELVKCGRRFVRRIYRGNGWLWEISFDR